MPSSYTMMYTRVQKKRDSFTCSFLALTYWLHLNLAHNKQLDEMSIFQVEKNENKIYDFVGKRLNFLRILIKFKLNQYVNNKNEQVNE